MSISQRVISMAKQRLGNFARGFQFRGFSPKPRYLVIEPTNKCILRCPFCATAHNMKRPLGQMSLDTFRFILDQVSWPVKMFNFDFAGEPLLNPDIFKMISLSHQKGIKSGFDTNGVLLENYVSEVIESGLQYLNIAIDGVTPESHSKYRVGADLNRILAAAKRLCEEKIRRKSLTPIVAFQMIVMKHNQHQMPQLLKMAKEFKVDRVIFKSLNLDLGMFFEDSKKARDAQEFLPTLPKFSRYRLTKDGFEFKKSSNHICHFPYNCMVVLHNGDVILCCLDFNGRHVLGNIRQQSLLEIWQSKKFHDYRKLVSQKSLDICKNCNFTDSLNEVIAIPK